MQFDFDLAHRILTTIEDLPPDGSVSTHSFIDEYQFPDKGEAFTPYDIEFLQVSYHMKLLIDSGLLEAHPFPGSPATDYTVMPGLSDATGLTLEGHQYLAMLRNDTTLNRLKEKIKTGFWGAVDALSIDALRQLIF